MVNVIINADDFGINKVVTSEISRLISEGLISSTTIMANGTDLESATQTAKTYTRVSYGVHVCLSEFSSLTKSSVLEKYNITDESGTFITKAILNIKNPTDELKKAIEDEIEQQIDAVSRLGFPISHIDSHHHVHSMPWVFSLFEKAAQQYGIKKIRLAPDFLDLRSKLHILFYIERIKLNKKIKNTFTTTDSFMSYSAGLKYVEMIKKRGMNAVELMCHPGHPSEKYRQEMINLEKQKLSEGLDYKLISYNEL